MIALLIFNNLSEKTEAKKVLTERKRHKAQYPLNSLGTFTKSRKLHHHQGISMIFLISMRARRISQRSHLFPIHQWSLKVVFQSLSLSNSPKTSVNLRNFSTKERNKWTWWESKVRRAHQTKSQRTLTCSVHLGLQPPHWYSRPRLTLLLQWRWRTPW